jgi:hypothetical protein
VDGSLLKSMLRWVAPAEAEAKVVGSPEALAVLKGMLKSGDPEDYLAQRYRQIVRRAEESPSQVEVFPAREHLSNLKAAGAYYPDTRTVLYNPTYPTPDLRENFAHELTHFLATEANKGQARPEEEHRLIRQFLGTDTFDPARRFSQSGFTPGPDASLGDLETFEGWLAPALRYYQTGQGAPPLRPAGWPSR